jgi:hypothetical protein
VIELSISIPASFEALGIRLWFGKIVVTRFLNIQAIDPSTVEI